MYREVELMVSARPGDARESREALTVAAFYWNGRAGSESSQYGTTGTIACWGRVALVNVVVILLCK